MSDEEYFEQLVSSSLDGTLTESEREKLDEHLAEGPSCAALKQDLEQMRALFAVEAELPAGLHEDIMQGVRQQERLRVVQPEKPVRRLPVLTMVAAAAVVVLVVLGGGLMPAFSTVGGSSDTCAADTATAEANAGSDDAGQMVRGAAEDAGLAGGEDAGSDGAAADSNGTTGASAEPSVQPKGGTGATGGSTGAAAPESGAASGGEVWAELQPSTGSGDAGTQSVHPDATLIDALPAVTVPSSLRGSHVAHSYLATGGAEVPDISGELLYTGDGVSWFSLENNMAILQDTLRTLEDAGFAVSAFEDVSLILDSKATTWLLAVETGA